MPKKSRKLPMSRETLRHLTPEALGQAAGGWIRPPITWSCPQPVVLSASCRNEDL